MMQHRSIIAIFKLLLLLCVVGTTHVYSQKVVGDMSLHYELVAANNPHLDSGMISSAKKSLYVRGGMSLSTLNFNGFNQSIIYNKNGDKAYILYELNNQDYMSILSKDQWLQQYSRYKDLKLTINKNKTKQILGYSCMEALATLQDGTQISIYFYPKLKPTVSDNPYEADAVPGLILEYQVVVQDKYILTFTATSIDFSPVPAARFIIPKEGYRLLDGSE